jgi:hypothetical protein
MTSELAVAVPHGALKRERQLVTATPSLDVDEPTTSRRLSVIVPVVPPSPARPENGTTAIVAPRRSSSSHTACRAVSSRRPGRSRAVCGWEASRPTGGVWHRSPESALHVGQRRVRHPRATCSRAAGSQRALYEYRCLSRQRVPGAARHSGHHSASHARRSLTAGSPLAAAARGHRLGHRFSGAAQLPVACGRERRALRYLASPWWPPTGSSRPLRRYLHGRRGTCAWSARNPSPQIPMHPWCTLSHD